MSDFSTVNLHIITRKKCIVKKLFESTFSCFILNRGAPRVLWDGRVPIICICFNPFSANPTLVTQLTVIRISIPWDLDEGFPLSTTNTIAKSSNRIEFLVYKWNIACLYQYIFFMNQKETANYVISQQLYISRLLFWNLCASCLRWLIELWVVLGTYINTVFIYIYWNRMIYI